MICEPLFHAITSDDWRRSLASARARRATKPGRLPPFYMSLIYKSEVNPDMKRIAEEATVADAFLVKRTLVAERKRICSCIDEMIRKLDANDDGFKFAIATLKAVKDNFVNTP